MCGIAGVIFSDRRPVSQAGLDAAAAQLRHRGPDDSRVWVESGAGFAHTRLAILDRDRGKQPVFTEDGRYVAVFNGEIYNHHELRSELEGHGFTFKTRCDTEILPYLYAFYGAGMVDRLRGMFTFAILDRRERSLFLARDRFGKKPLYVAQTKDGLAFASTTDALSSVTGTSLEVDEQSLFEYLVLQYVPSPRSPFAGMMKLSPGHTAEWRGGEFRTSAYWQPPMRAGGRRAVKQFGASDLAALRETIAESVAIRLESEVPLGIFLSGGLDSSVVVAEAANAGIRPKTFSVGFHHADLDETRYAALVAERFGTEHTRLVADDDVRGLFERFTEAYDEPFADSSSLATLSVAKAAAEHVTVVLTGDGGDETFGGYGRYEWFRRSHRLGRTLGPVRTLAGMAAETLGRLGRRSSLRQAGVLLRDPWSWYRDSLFHFSIQQAHGILRPDVAKRVDPVAPVARLDAIWARGSGSVGDLPFVDAHTYLPDDLLTKMDRATMAFSLEARSPLLDHVLAERAARYPDRWLFAPGQGKLILREAYRDVLPAPILSRPKMGFGVPIETWLRGPLRSEVERLLLAKDAVVWEWLRRDRTVELVRRFLDHGDVAGRLAWNLTALAGWADRRFRAKDPLVSALSDDL